MEILSMCFGEGKSYEFCRSKQASKLLIVDDEKDLVWLFSNIFKENGYEVFGCHDGSSALKQVRKIKPAVVLLDYNLPDMNGLQLLKKLHLVGRDHIKGIIMASGTSDPEVKPKVRNVQYYMVAVTPMLANCYQQYNLIYCCFPDEIFRQNIAYNTCI